MTVSELTEKLNGLPKEMPIVVRGYEGGYDDVNDIKVLKLELNPKAWNSKYKDYYWFYGVYEQVCEESKNTSFDAVFIEQFDESNKHKLKHETILSETV